VTLFSVRNSSCGGPSCNTGVSQQYSQPIRQARKGWRQSFVLLLQQNHSGLNYRRSSLVKVDKQSGLSLRKPAFLYQDSLESP